MVNSPSDDAIADRRQRPRPTGKHAAALGAANLNPFGDLHTIQHLSTLFARSSRSVFEQLLRREIRSWAEPLIVQRFADYRAERADGLAAWVPITMGPTKHVALAVFEGKFILELLEQFFGGNGEAPNPLPTEFTPAAEAMINRLMAMLAAPLKSAWEPLARIDFRAGHPENSAALLADIDGDDAMVVTRFGIAADAGKPTPFDLIYPVSALKPYAPSLTGKVHGRSAEPDPAWRNGLANAVMAVKFPVRSVLAEPMIPLARLIELKTGDVIPINFGNDVPVMVGRDRLGTGTVGTSNGHAAIRMTRVSIREEEDYR